MPRQTIVCAATPRQKLQIKFCYVTQLTPFQTVLALTLYARRLAGKLQKNKSKMKSLEWLNRVKRPSIPGSISRCRGGRLTTRPPMRYMAGNCTRGRWSSHQLCIRLKVSRRCLKWSNWTDLPKTNHVPVQYGIVHDHFLLARFSTTYLEDIIARFSFFPLIPANQKKKKKKKKKNHVQYQPVHLLLCT